MRLRPAHLAWPLTIVLVAVLLVLGALAVLMATETGTRWAVHRVIALAGVPLQIDGLQGSLLRGVSAERLVYRTDTTEVEAMTIALDPNWWASLAEDRLIVRQATAESLAVRRLVLPEPVPPEDAPPIDFTFPRFPVLSLQVDDLRVARFRFEELADDWAPEVRGGAFWSHQEFRVWDLHVDAPNMRLTSPALTLQLEGEQAIGGELSWRILDEAYAGRAIVGGTLRELEIDHRLTRPFAANARGTLGLVGSVEPTADLVIDIPELVVDPVRVENILGTLQGTPSAYTGTALGEVEVELALDGNPRVHGPARVAFGGNRDGIELRPAVFDANAGEVTGRGRLMWVPQFELVLDLDGRRIDPSVVGAPETGDVTLDGRLRYADQRLALSIEALTGTYADRHVTASGELIYTDGVLSTDGLELRSGENQLRATGRIGQGHVDAGITLALGEPQLFVPDVAGALQGEAHIVGPLDAFDATVSLRADALSWQGLTFQDARLSAQRRADIPHNRIALAAARFDYTGEIALRDVSLTVEGDDARAEYALDTRFDEEPASHVRGQLVRHDDGVDVHVETAARVATPYGHWQLDRATDVRVRAHDLEVTAHCWRRIEETGRVCLESLRRVGPRTELAGQIEALPLQWVRVFVEGMPHIDGEIEADWQVQHDAAAGTLGGRAEWRTVGLGLAEFADGEADAVIDLPDLSGMIDFAGDRIDATVFSVLEGERVIDVEVSVIDPLNARRLDGRAMLLLPSVEFVAMLFEELDAFEGAIVGIVMLGGTVDAPDVRSQLQLTDGRLVWMEPYIELQQLTLRAEMDEPRQIRLSGSATSGRRGQLTVEGAVNQPFAPERSASVALQGREVLVQIPDSQAWIDPDLTLTWRPERATVDGVISVPRALVSAPELPATAIARSPDVIVIDRVVEPDEPLRVAVDVLAVIGDDVRFRAQGLNVRIVGDLRVQRTLEGVVTLQGRVDIPEGQFTAYGQTLEIDTGSLTFSGPPENPFVDARASRRIERPQQQDIVVGIVITGELDNLESTLFSEPPMPDGDALAYLMLGRSLGAASPGEGDQLVGAALALGLQQAAPLIDEVGRALGLDEFAAVGEDGDDLTVIAGKQLTNRLFVRYYYQAFLGVSEMLVRYQLTDRLSLETTTGETPGIDVMYRVTN